MIPKIKLMKSIINILLITLFTNSCKTKKQDDLFDRFVIATTYQNNNLSREDSLEMTNTICTSLIYFDRHANCFIFERKKSGVEFYKCKLTESISSNLIYFISDLQKRFPKKRNISEHCAPDISIILENDTITDYHFIQSYENKDLEFISKFIQNNKQTSVDSIETILKFKHYIVSEVAYSNQRRYGFEPVNYKYLTKE
jgi:hypothetical protein